MDDRLKMIYLMDIYSELLTEKQRHVLNLYYNEDMTISEISDCENVSRQAAFDLIKRVTNILLSYDEKLGLFDKYLENTSLLDEIEKYINLGLNEKAVTTISKLKENL